MPEDYGNPIPCVRYVLLIAGLLALTLFVLGPLAGSLDDDGDGIPDIPVVVYGPSLLDYVARTAGVSQRIRPIHDGVLSTIIAIHTRNIGIAGSNCVFDAIALDGRSLLRCSCMLRC